MGRKQILGKIVCPVCNNLCRIVSKKVRNRPSGRYVEYAYARHNDRSIKEHYIDNFTKPPVGQRDVFDVLHNDESRIVHYAQKLLKKIQTFPLEREDRIWLISALKWQHDNILLPMNILKDHITGIHKLPEGMFDYVLKLFMENVFSDKNFCGPGYKPLYLKYDRPRRLERNMRRNKLLSESHFGSEKFNKNYTGIPQTVRRRKA